MRIWVDGDACPKVIKELIFNASLRLKIPVTVVANRWQKLPNSTLITLEVVSKGFDEADHFIIENAVAQEVVITADIPLAYELVKNKVSVLSPKGELFSEANIGERLAMRDLLSGLRSTGEIQGGGSAFSDRDKKRFADALQNFLMGKR